MKQYKYNKLLIRVSGAAKNMKTFVAIALFVAVFVSSSSALRCYNCVFPGNANCQDMKDLKPEECSELTSVESSVGVKAVCLKSVIDVGGNVKQITRSCTREGLKINPCSAFNKAGELEHCSVCEKDLCNGSSHLLISIWTTLAPMVVVVFLKYF